MDNKKTPFYLVSVVLIVYTTIFMSRVEHRQHNLYEREKAEATAHGASQEKTKSLQIQLAKAEEHKSREPVKYIDTAIALALAYREEGDIETANSTYTKVLKFYVSEVPAKKLSDLDVKAIWDYLNLLEPKSFWKNFPELLTATEAKNANVVNAVLERQIRDLEPKLNAYSSGDAERALLNTENAINLRARQIGVDNPDLEPLYRDLAFICRKENRDKSALDLYVRANTLMQKQSAETQCMKYLDLVQFAVRHKWYPAANDAFDKALKCLNGNVSERAAREFEQTLSTYEDFGNPADVERVMFALLTTGGDKLIPVLDPRVDQMVNAYSDAGDFAHAKSTIEARLKATSTMSNDAAENDWRLRLSSIELVMGDDVESQKHYDEVLKKVGSQSEQGKQIIAKRSEFVQKISAMHDKSSANANSPVVREPAGKGGAAKAPAHKTAAH